MPYNQQYYIKEVKVIRANALTLRMSIYGNKFDNYVISSLTTKGLKFTIQTYYKNIQSGYSTKLRNELSRRQGKLGELLK